ncbi:GL26337 [Drosophila persimilis]|uniref:GL26337 n=1 Tax=Drosophila persimilis TaxID=7234 RepID=B4GT85_DROPE|nr:GL26337 [Drosophila persimilis]
MTSPHSETPLRRSAVGSYRKNDEAERQEARRRTPLVQQDTRTSSALESIEENETIRSCVDLYNRNKLNKDNVWNMSLIDTLANLMDRHHKQLNNFKNSASSQKTVNNQYESSKNQEKICYRKTIKLILPTKLNFETDYFVKYDSAESITFSQRFGEADLVEGLGNNMDMDGGSHHDD